MRKAVILALVLVAVLVILPAIALAQSNTNPDWPLAPCTGTGVVPMQPPTAPAELPPELGGRASKAVVEINTAGAAAGWWYFAPEGMRCRETGDRRCLSRYAVRHDAFTPALRADLQALLTTPAAQRAEAIRAMAARHQTTHFSNMADVWCGEWRRQMNLALPDLPAGPPQWRTPTTGSGALYRVVNGSRSSIIPGRTVPPGSPCDCSDVRIVYFTGTFCPPAGGPASEVTLCRSP